METYEHDLRKFEADGAAALPVADERGYLTNDGARIWYSTRRSGPPVIMLHGGLGHSGNRSYQVPALVKSGYRAVLKGVSGSTAEESRARRGQSGGGGGVGGGLGDWLS